MHRPLGKLLTFSGFLIIAAATLSPVPQQAAASQSTPLWCLLCGEYGGVDVFNNLLLFIPFALGLRLLGVRTRRVVVAGAAISLTVELLQLAVVPGRDASLSDLLTNTLGSWIGAAIAGHGTQLVRPLPRQAIRLASAAALLWLVIQTATGMLLRPWVGSDELRAGWSRSETGGNRFDGTVTSASVLGAAVPDGSTARSSDLLPNLRQGRIQLELGLLSGRKPAVWSPVFELRGRSGSVLSIEAVRRDLVFQVPARSHLVRLRRPALRLPRALPSKPGVPVEVSAGERGDTLWAAWRVADLRHSSMQVLSPSLGWSLLTPIRYAFGREAQVLTGLWLAVWLLPIGYWSARTGRKPRAALLALGLLLLLGLGLIPHLLGYPAGPWTEWLAGGLGAGVGWGRASIRGLS